MKMRKWISTLCAAALLVSTLPAASAVEAEPLSEYAGQTIAVQVKYIGADEQFKRRINVDIPDNATSKEAQELIHEAALATTGPTTRAVNGVDYLYQGARFAVRSSSFSYIPNIYLERDYSKFVFQFNSGEYSGNPTVLTLQVTDNYYDPAHVFTVSEELTDSYTGGTKETEIVIIDGEVFSGKGIYFSNGQYFKFGAKVDSGSITFAGFMIKGYY